MALRNREVTRNIIVGATETKPGKPLSEWELSLPDLERGVSGCGFHFAIQPDGSVLQLRAQATWANLPLSLERYNHDSVVIRLVGTKESFSPDQVQTLNALLDALAIDYPQSCPLYIY